MSTEYSTTVTLFNKVGKFFIAVDGYFLLNGRLGFKATNGLSAFIWGRNILNKDYFEQLLPAAGNAGHYTAVLGDVRTFGVTLRYAYQPASALFHIFAVNQNDCIWQY